MYISARKALKALGFEAYDMEARLIVSAASGKSKEKYLQESNLYVADDKFEDKVQELIQRRVSGEPIAYVVGEWEFYGLPIQINPDVLIPRVDTEVLVDKAIDFLKTRQDGIRVLDLCSGSGCVGLAIAANAPFCRVVLVDNSEGAQHLARLNILNNKLTRGVTTVTADAKQSPPMLLGRFDAIVCNPPYIPTKDIAKLDASVKDYEPIHALDGGGDGLDFYRVITERWDVVLKDGGAVLFECGIGQAESVKRIMEQNGFTDIEIFKDTMGIDRVVKGIRNLEDTE